MEDQSRARCFQKAGAGANLETLTSLNPSFRKEGDRKKPFIKTKGLRDIPQRKTRTGLLPQIIKRLQAVVAGGVAEFFLDAKQLIVLGDSVGASGSARLDLARIRRHDDVGDGRVFRLARAVRNDRRVARRASPSRWLPRSRSSVPIWFTFTKIAFAVRESMPRFKNFVLVTNRSSPTIWTVAPRRSVSSFQVRPVVFGQAVFDGQNGIACAEAGVVIHHLGARQGPALAFQDVIPVVVELGGRRVHAEHDLLARLVARRFDGLDDHLQRRLVRRQVRREAALVPDARVLPLLLQARLSGRDRCPRPSAGPRKSSVRPRAAP